MGIEIRDLKTQKQFRACEEIQKRVWGMEEREVVPHHILTGIQLYGGNAMGAYDQGEMVGFVFGFQGEHAGKRCLYSHMCAVKPDRRFSGVGYRLKLRQREFADSVGLDLVIWTFDPLEGANAYFNFHKLGVVSETYIRDYYGEIRDTLNRGLETDRLLVEWWIRSPRVERRIGDGSQRVEMDPDVSVVNPMEHMGRTALRKDEPDRGRGQRSLLMEIPDSIQRLKDDDMNLAREWRAGTRVLFESYMAKGYVVADFLSKWEDDRRRNFYFLKRGAKEDILEI